MAATDDFSPTIPTEKLETTSSQEEGITHLGHKVFSPNSDEVIESAPKARYLSAIRVDLPRKKCWSDINIPDSSEAEAYFALKINLSSNHGSNKLIFTYEVNQSTLRSLTTYKETCDDIYQGFNRTISNRKLPFIEIVNQYLLMRRTRDLILQLSHSETLTIGTSLDQSLALRQTSDVLSQMHEEITKSFGNNRKAIYLIDILLSSGSVTHINFGLSLIHDEMRGPLERRLVALTESENLPWELRREASSHLNSNEREEILLRRKQRMEATIGNEVFT